MSETPEAQAITPTAQALGRAGGLWTHTPVDWRGNETGVKPGNWPTDAKDGQPGLGTRPLEFMPPPGLTVLVSTPATGQVTITWNTSVLSDSSVDIGTTTAYGTHAYDPTMTLTHSMLITGLTAGLKHYRASSQGSGYSVVSVDSTTTIL
jgi:hypothetical protein